MINPWILSYGSYDYDGPEGNVLLFSTQEKAEEWAKKNLLQRCYHEIKEYTLDSGDYHTIWIPR